MVWAIWLIAALTFSIATTDFTASMTRKYATADTSTLTLSRVMIPWDWIGIVTIRSETRFSTSTNGTITRSPGLRVPTTRPRRNSTPSSYCLTILRDNAARTARTATMTTMTTTAFMALPGGVARRG